ncbi:MAG: hypothetical protein ACK40H_02655 [Sphingomonadaceae bacterium]
MPPALALALLLATTLSPGTAQAYVDPNVGSQIWQAIYPVVAVVLGALAFARQWVAHLAGRIGQRLRRLVTRREG